MPNLVARHHLPESQQEANRQRQPQTAIPSGVMPHPNPTPNPSHLGRLDRAPNQAQHKHRRRSSVLPLLVFHSAMEHVHTFQAVQYTPLKFIRDKDRKWVFASWLSKRMVHFQARVRGTIVGKGKGKVSGRSPSSSVKLPVVPCRAPSGSHCHRHPRTAMHSCLWHPLGLVPGSFRSGVRCTTAELHGLIEGRL